jgi:monofunctional biosynthetic peptidoglycan transglycosylase
VDAVVVAEDPNFFVHKGIDWEALREAARTDIRLKRYFSGGSTITQQLAKNLYFTSQKSLVRKVREFIVAQWLEGALNKMRILEIYLNVIEWGDGVYGCEAAARHYYGKSASDLSAEEAAGLAAMIPSPRRLNPDVNPRRHALATRRVLLLMSMRSDLRRATGAVGAIPADDAMDDEDEAAPAPSKAAAVPPDAAPGEPPPSALPASEPPESSESPFPSPEPSPPV